MLMILSPAKTFNEVKETLLFEQEKLRFSKETSMLLECLGKYTVEDLGKLMKMSEALSILNYERFQSFPDNNEPAYWAIDYFYGEAYKGLSANSLSEKGRNYAKDHLCILSGLYGIIQPFDIIKPYRLEMGTKLENPSGKNLYIFWKEKLTQVIKELIKNSEGEKVLINLASDEYSKVLDLKEIKRDYGVLHISFKVDKGKGYQSMSMYAKKARGLMARYILENQLQTVDELKKFDQDGYSLNEELSSEQELVFTKCL